MWSLHVVHHSDHKLNLSTASRASWVELLYLPLFYLPLVFLGFHPYMIFLCYYIVFNHAFWVHSQYIKLPFFLDYLIFIPQNHQVHHDREIQNQNSNFGGLFTIWDRLLGTFKRSVDNFTAGLKDYKEENFLKFQVHTTLKLLKKL
jgi:sterol desaturase/sphingolipid hydroxylase (fatty acid hydroxylase superfamily)